MHPKNKLAEIEIVLSTYPKPVGYEEMKWLINRVKRLTEALEKITECYDDFNSHDEIARKALSEGEE